MSKEVSEPSPDTQQKQTWSPRNVERSWFLHLTCVAGCFIQVAPWLVPRTEQEPLEPPEPPEPQSFEGTEPREQALEAEGSAECKWKLVIKKRTDKGRERT